MGDPYSIDIDLATAFGGDATICLGSFHAGVECGHAIMLAKLGGEPFEITVWSENAWRVISVLQQIGWRATWRLVHDDWAQVSAEPIEGCG